MLKGKINMLLIIGKYIISLSIFYCSCGTQKPKRRAASYRFEKSRRSLSRWGYRETEAITQSYGTS
jgi:hypothetical protein